MVTHTTEAVKRGNKVTRTIHRRLRKKGYKVGLHTLGNWLWIDTIHYDMTEMVENAHGITGRKPSSRLAIKFGINSRHSNSKMRRFPEPKDGFDIDKLVAAIAEYIDEGEVYEAQVNKKLKQEGEASLAAELVERGFPTLKHCIGSTSGGVRLTFDGVTPEQAEALLEAAMVAGVGQ